MKHLDRITTDPRVCQGQAVVRGMRITVSAVLKVLAPQETRDKADARCLVASDRYRTQPLGSGRFKCLASGKSTQEVLAIYPELEEEDVRQAIAHGCSTTSGDSPVVG